MEIRDLSEEVHNVGFPNDDNSQASSRIAKMERKIEMDRVEWETFTANMIATGYRKQLL
jgi:hypothetical protein